jgi:hypothetical protein
MEIAWIILKILIQTGGVRSEEVGVRSSRKNPVRVESL